LGTGGFFSKDFRIKLCAEPPINIKFDADYMSGFRFCGLGEFNTFMGEEMGLTDSGIKPHGFEPGDALLPGVEDIEGGEIRIGFDNFKNGIITFRDDVAEFLCESAGKFGFWIAFITRFGVSGEGTKVLDRRGKEFLHGINVLRRKKEVGKMKLILAYAYEQYC
jgi:hypothetical protein